MVEAVHLKKSKGTTRWEKEEKYQPNNEWLKTAPGATPPTTSTYERWYRRNQRYWMGQFERARADAERRLAERTPEEKRRDENFKIREKAEKVAHVNRFRKRHNASVESGKYNGKKLPMRAFPTTIRHLSKKQIESVKRNSKKKKSN